MNKTFVSCFVLMLFILLNVSCTKQIIENKKYRTINSYDNLHIQSKKGKITILGRTEAVIDIETTKVLNSGLKSDLQFLDTQIITEENKKTLLVKSIQPQRVDGEVHNIIYLPLSMKMITIETEEAETIIRDFTGIIEYNDKSGTIDAEFQGSIGYFFSERGRIILKINPLSRYDLIINNMHGITELLNITAEKPSFINVISNNGSIYADITKANSTTIEAYSTNEIVYDIHRFPKAIYESQNDFYEFLYTSQDSQLFFNCESTNGFVTIN